MNLSSNLKIDIWLRNVDNYYKCKKSKKSVIGTVVVTSEFLYIRRLFID